MKTDGVPALPTTRGRQNTLSYVFVGVFIRDGTELSVCVRMSVCLPLGVYSLGAQEVSHLLLPTESLMLGQPPFNR